MTIKIKGTISCLKQLAKEIALNPASNNIEELSIISDTISRNIDEMKDELTKAWKEAAVAWSCCASIHNEFAKKRDTLFTIRQKDFVQRKENAQEHYLDILEEDTKAN